MIHISPRHSRAQHSSSVPETLQIRFAEKQRRGATPSLYPLLMLLLLLFLGLHAHTYAQGIWENVHGATNKLEKGHDVLWATSVCSECNGCGIGDLISVGVTDPLTIPNDQDLYIVRTGFGGVTVWEQTIDMSGLNLNDIAYEVKDDPNTNEITIVGSTELPTNPADPNNPTQLDAFVLRIKCDGSFLMSRLYVPSLLSGQNPGDDVFYDIMLVTPGSFGLPYDYIAVGYSDHWNNGTTDAIITRLDYWGGIIWANRYQSGTPGLLDEVFYSVDQVAGGDIVAGGFEEITATGERNGYAVRVNPANGLPVGPNRGSGIWGSGNGQDDEIRSIIRLDNPAENGAVAMTGLTQNNKVYLARVNNANFSFGMINGPEFAIAVPGPSFQPAYGVGNDIVEVKNPWAGGMMQQWDLAITGTTTYAGLNLDYDAFLFTYRNPFGGGLPIGVIRNRFGGPSAEEGNALVESPGGFGITGSTLTDFANVNDVGDLYLLSTSWNGNTGCETPMNEVAQSNINHASTHSDVLAWGVMSARNPVQTPVNWRDFVCSCTGCKTVPTDFGGALSGPPTEEPTSGEPLATLSYSRGEAIVIPNEASAEVMVYNIAGATVAQFGSEDEIRVETSDWPTGLYLMQIQYGEKVERYRVTISE